MGHRALEKTTSRKHKRGLWSPEEDQKLHDYILHYGISCWSSVPTNAGLQRNGKSCRLRWVNYLRPGVKRGLFSSQEEETIITLHKTLGNKWSQIAKQLPGRTDNEIKNVWHSYLKKKAANSDETKINPQPKFIDLSCKQENDFSLNQTTINDVSEIELEPNKIQDRMSNIEQRNQVLLPRLLFSDWLPPSHDYTTQNRPDFQQGSSKDGLDSSISEKQDEDFLQCFQYNNEGSSTFIDKFFHGEIGDGFENGLLDLPFSLLDQSTIGHCSMAFSAENAAYSGF